MFKYYFSKVFWISLIVSFFPSLLFGQRQILEILIYLCFLAPSLGFIVSTVFIRFSHKNITAQQQLQLNLRAWLQEKVAEDHLHAFLMVGAEAERKASTCAPQGLGDGQADVAFWVIEADERDDCPIADVTIIEVDPAKVAERFRKTPVCRPGHQPVWRIGIGDFHLQEA